MGTAPPPAGATVTSPAHPAVKAARRLARLRGRAGDGRFLVEGPPAVSEAVSWLQRLFVTPAAASRDPDLVQAARAAGADVVVCSERVLANLSSTVTPQGLIGVARLPAAGRGALPEAAELVVVGDRIADPGNVGAVVRSADAAGADAVVVTAGSVDPCNPKAVRASAGSLFHLPVLTGATLAQVAGDCRARGLRLVAAAAHGGVRYTDADLARPTALVLGNEAHGLDLGARGLCDLVVTVPMPRLARPGFSGHAESLNLAATAAVLAFEAARQRHAAATTRESP